MPNKTAALSLKRVPRKFFLTSLKNRKRDGRANVIGMIIITKLIFRTLQELAGPENLKELSELLRFYDDVLRICR